MADVVLFSSDATGTKRLALIADDADPTNVPLRIEIRDASNSLNITHVLSTSDRSRITQFWNATKIDRTQPLKLDNPQLWFAINTDNTSVWSDDVSGNATTAASSEVTLDAFQTATVAAWCQHGYVV